MEGCTIKWGSQKSTYFDLTLSVYKKCICALGPQNWNPLAINGFCWTKNDNFSKKAWCDVMKNCLYNVSVFIQFKKICVIVTFCTSKLEYLSYVLWKTIFLKVLLKVHHYSQTFLTLNPTPTTGLFWFQFHLIIFSRFICCCGNRIYCRHYMCGCWLPRTLLIY